MNTKLLLVQPGAAQREKVALCVLAAETCRGREGTHAGEEIAYLKKIEEMGHLSIFEHARYFRLAYDSGEVRLPGHTKQHYIESSNGRYIIEHENYNPVTVDVEYEDLCYDAMQPSQKIKHASATFLIECSRITSHQLVRHRMGSYSQQSQRHAAISNEDGFWYATPKSLKKDVDLSSWYHDMLEEAGKFYQCAQMRGVPMEDARYILPGSTLTKIVVTMTFEWWLHFLKLRLNHAAQWEIRTIAGEIKDALLGVDEDLFAPLFEAMQ